MPPILIASLRSLRQAMKAPLVSSSALVLAAVYAFSVPFAVEWDRRRKGFKNCLEKARRRGARISPLSGRFSPDSVRRAAQVIDVCFPGGPNCFRRVLLELSLDERAGALIVRMGFRSSFSTDSGHVWLGDRDREDDYDWVVSV